MKSLILSLVFSLSAAAAFATTDAGPDAGEKQTPLVLSSEADQTAVILKKNGDVEAVTATAVPDCADDLEKAACTVPQDS